MREHHTPAQTEQERLNEAITDLSKKGRGLIDRFFEYCGPSETSTVYLKFVADELWQFDFTFPHQILEVTTLNEANEDVVYDFEPVEGKLSCTEIHRTAEPDVETINTVQDETFYPDDLFHQIEPEKALLYVEDGQPSYQEDTLYLQIGTEGEPEQTLLTRMKRTRDGRSTVSSFEYQVSIGPTDEIVRKKTWTYRIGQIHHNYITSVMDPIPVNELTLDQRIDACREGVDLLEMLWNETLSSSQHDGDGDGDEGINSIR